MISFCKGQHMHARLDGPFLSLGCLSPDLEKSSFYNDIYVLSERTNVPR
jgi:hypothetical protein